MSHFDQAAETSETPSEADKLVSELEAMFGFHPGDSEQSEPTVEKTFDDDPEVKESAIAKLERLLEIRRAEAGATNRDTLALALDNALAEGAVPETITRVIELLAPPQLSPAALPTEKESRDWHRKWLIPGWLPEDTVTLLSAKGGIGKSYLVLQQMCMLAMGYGNCWLKTNCPNPGTMVTGAIDVVIANWEDEPEETGKRIVDICDTMNWAEYDTITSKLHYVDMKRGGNVWGIAEQGNRYEPNGLQQAGKQILEICEQKKAKLLVLDPLSGAFGGNENDRADVYRFVSTLRAWAQSNKCAVLIVAHIPADESKKWSGSTAWLGSVRSAWYLGIESETTGAGKNSEEEKWWQLEQLKVNYSKPQQPKYLVKQENGVWSEAENMQIAHAKYKKYQESMQRYNPDIDPQFIRHTTESETNHENTTIRRDAV